jgi:hypothetical protein
VLDRPHPPLTCHVFLISTDVISTDVISTEVPGAVRR